MPNIGTFTPSDTGYIGTIRTLMLNGTVTLIAIDEKSGETAPDFKVMLDGNEIGAAWRHTKKGSDQTYLRVRIDDPAFPQPIWAVLSEAAQNGAFPLMWRRHRYDPD